MEADRIQAAGIRKVEGKWLDLYTDIPEDPSIAELPGVFDQAVSQWCEFFTIPTEKLRGWRIVGSLIKDRQRFSRAGLLPDSLPPFQHGYSSQFQIWFYEQPSEYYRRHLMLHEGTHAFMIHFLQGAGPPWFMEGMAELLGTHRWDGKQLTLRHFPADKQETPHWGRVKIVQDDLAAGRGMPLEAIMNYGSDAHLKVQPYGWCWAAASFFDFHPHYQQAFRKLIAHSRDSSGTFNEVLLRSLADEWPRVSQEWQLYVLGMDYGYDVAREAIDPRDVKPLPQDGGSFTVRADRGWQSTGYRIEAGATLELTARGQFQLASDPRPWISEAGGVTIEYHRGKPLGMLLAAVAYPGEAGLTRLANPHPLGVSGKLECAQEGILYLRVNDRPSRLSDNKGQLEVSIQRENGG